MVPVQLQTTVGDTGSPVVRKTYNNDVPEELKRHPNYIEGKTKVTTETKTLADGTVVKTTRYETKGDQVVSSSSRQQTSSSTKEFGSSQAVKSSSQTTSESKTSKTVSNVRDYNDTERNVTRSVDTDIVPVRFDSTTTKTSHVVKSGGASTNIEQSKNVSATSSTTDSVKINTDVNIINNKSSLEAVRNNEVQDFSSKIIESSRRDERSTRSATDNRDFTDFSSRKTEVVSTTRDDLQPVCYTTNEIRRSDVTTKDVAKNFIDIEQQTRQEFKADSKVDNFVKTERKYTIQQQTSPQESVPEKYQAPASTYPSSNYEPSEPSTPRYDTPEAQKPIRPSNYEPSEPSTPRYDTPEMRKPIRPGKSELDEKSKPTDGQYDTTYRTDYTSKRISVDNSPTHNAFASSLRSISPDRISSRSTSTRASNRSFRTSSTSLRSSASPEKTQHPSRFSPDRKSPNNKSPDKFSSTETITKGHYKPEYKYNTCSTDTLTKKRTKTDSNVEVTKTQEDAYDSSTITRRRKVVDTKTSKGKPRSRSTSPTSSVSDFEYVKNTNDIVTDLDEDFSSKTAKVTNTFVTEQRPRSLDISSTVTTKKYKKLTERSPTSPLPSPKKSPSPVKETNSRRNSLKSPVKDVPERPKDKPLKRRDTYEERCRQILGISNATTDKSTRKHTQVDDIDVTISKTKPKSPTKTRDFPGQDRKSPEKQIKDFPVQIKKSPEKEPSQKYLEKTKPTKESPKIKEFPSQIRKSPEKEPLEKYPEKVKIPTDGPKIQEFPSQIRRTPEKESLEKYPEKTKAPKEGPKIQEFPSQVRKSPEKESLEKYPEKAKSTKEEPKIQEFPSLIRKSPEREPLNKYPEKKTPQGKPIVQECPSEIRKSLEKEPLEEYPAKQKPSKEGTQLHEFPSQIRKSSEKQPLEIPEERPKISKDTPSIQEFPSQIRKSPEKETLPEYPKKSFPDKKAPSIEEFPSQIRRSPEKEPLGEYPEKSKPCKEAPSIQEFPSQIRKSPEKEFLDKYSEKRQPDVTSSVQQFIQKEQESLITEKSPAVQKNNVDVCSSQTISVTEKIKKEKSAKPEIQEFPSQIRKTPKKETAEKPQQKTQPEKEQPKIKEFPSQVRKSPEKQPLEKYPEKSSPTKDAPKIQEFPSQIRKSPEKSPQEKYPEKPSLKKEAPKIQEFPSQIRKTPAKPKPESPEINVCKVTPLYESKVPVDEPIVTKKFMYTLGEDEDDNRDTRTHKTVKKDLSRRMELESQIEKERPAGRVTTPKTPVKAQVKENKTSIRKTATDKVKTEINKSKIEKKDSFTTQRTKEISKPKSLTNADAKRKPTEKVLFKTTSTVERNVAKATEKPITKTITRRKTLSPDRLVQEMNIKNERLSQTSNTVTRKICSKPEKQVPQAQSPKRHVVTTVITVTAKTTPEPLKTKKVTTTQSAKSTKTVARTQISAVKTKNPQKKVLNGHGPCESETESDTESINEVNDTEKKQERVQRGDISVTSKKISKTSRTVSDTTIKTPHKTPQRTTSKPDFNSKPTTEQSGPKSPKTETKCITTKSIIINNDICGPRDVIVDLQRSKSSREPSPDRICPRPVSEDEDVGVPRYPDQVSEPDDGSLRRKPKRLSDIPIMETEIIEDFNRISEIIEEDKKSAALFQKKEDITVKVEETDKDDDYNLSVSDKVSKFITTAQQLTATPQGLPERPKSPRCQNYSEDFKVEKDDESLQSVSEKISRFATTAKNITKDVKSTITDKFIVAEKTADIEKPVSLAKIDVTPKRQSPPKEILPPRKSSLKKFTPERETSPRRSCSPKDIDSTPRSSRRTSTDESRSVLSSVSRLRSTESIKKAKALFENINKEQEILKQRDILSRPSVFQKSPQTPVKPQTNGETKESISRTRLDFVDKNECTTKTITQKEEALRSARLILDGVKPKSQSPERSRSRSTSPQKDKDIPHYMTPLDRNRQRTPSPEKEPEIERESTPVQETLPESDLPGYMRPLDRSLKPHSPHRESVEALRKLSTDDTEIRTTRFGVTLRRTDSGRTVKTTSTTEQKRSSVSEKADSEKEIEDIYDLEVLEQMVRDKFLSCIL